MSDSSDGSGDRARDSGNRGSGDRARDTLSSVGRVLAGLGRALLSRPLSREEVEGASGALEDAEPGDIVDAVHALVEEGTDLEALKPAVSKLLNLLSKSLGKVDFKPEDPFFKSLVLENEAFLRELAELRPLAAELLKAKEVSLPALVALGRAVDELKAIDLHYIKKENVLFPYFESRYPRYRCISLMWALHDDMRSSLARLGEIARSVDSGPEADAREIAALLGRLFFDGHALALREEKLLFPVAASLLGEGEKRELFEESRALGFSFLDAASIAALGEAAASAPLAAGTPAAPLAGAGPTASAGTAAAAAPAGLGIPLDAGALSAEVLDLLLKELPVDITFVDAQDRVAYFSNGGSRVFPRTKAIIGRDVRNCHPAKSVDKVLGIIEAFKKGERDREDFWLETQGRFVRIEYRAIRDPSGLYLGTLEVSQDLTEARALKGEKRLASF
jgi:DUF438 domain-containing protein